MTIDEGYIKYDSRWTHGPAPDATLVEEIERWRQPLYAAGLIGHYADLDIGFGNLSVRAGEPGQFVITGTQTGHFATTGPEHYALVTRTDVPANTVWSTGPVKASSEAMTHATIYALDARIAAVVHVHSPALWSGWKGKLPTTDPDVPYGTPDMASEFDRLYRMGGFREAGVAVMGGHEDGLVSFGSSLQSAAERLLSLAPPAGPEQA